MDKPENHPPEAFEKFRALAQKIVNVPASAIAEEVGKPIKPRRTSQKKKDLTAASR